MKPMQNYHEEAMDKGGASLYDLQQKSLAISEFGRRDYEQNLLDRLAFLKGHLSNDERELNILLAPVAELIDENGYNPISGKDEQYKVELLQGPAAVLEPKNQGNPLFLQTLSAGNDLSGIGIGRIDDKPDDAVFNRGDGTRWGNGDVGLSEGVQQGTGGISFAASQHGFEQPRILQGESECAIIDYTAGPSEDLKKRGELLSMPAIADAAMSRDANDRQMEGAGSANPKLLNDPVDAALEILEHNDLSIACYGGKMQPGAVERLPVMEALRVCNLLQYSVSEPVGDVVLNSAPGGSGTLDYRGNAPLGVYKWVLSSLPFDRPEAFGNNLCSLSNSTADVLERPVSNLMFEGKPTESNMVDSEHDAMGFGDPFTQGVRSAMEPGSGRSISINLNRPMIEQLNITVSGGDEAVGAIKEQVEEALLEILNSANTM